MRRRTFLGKAAFVFSGLIWVPRAVADIDQNDPAFVGDSPNVGSSYLIQESCEGTGTPSGWTDSGSPNWDYTGVVLDGAQSLRCTGSGAAAYSSYSITAQDEFTAYWLYRAVSGSGAFNLAKLRNAGGTDLVTLYYDGFGGLNIYDHAASAIACTPVDSLSLGTTYSIWLRAKKGTGANGELELEFATNTTKTGAGNKHCLVTNSGLVNQIARLVLGDTGANTYDQVFDFIRGNPTIGSSPA